MDPSARERKLSTLLDVGRAMTAQRDVRVLMAFITDSVKRVLECDRCTVWRAEPKKQELYTYVAHGVGGELRIPITTGIAGNVVTTRASVNIPDAYQDPRFNPEPDKQTGYRTNSILAVPMRDMNQDVIGVLQALNPLDGKPFDRDDEELLMAIGGQAAVALENAELYQRMENLFEGVIKASVYAIESRDPTTSGHSERVARLTVGLARSSDGRAEGPWKGLRFSPDEIREIEVAALLHDFGKVGVREEVLVKAKKLYPGEMQAVGFRFAVWKQSLLLESARRKFELASKAGVEPVRKLIETEDERVRHLIADLESTEAFVRQCNEPTVLEQGGFERLQDIARQKCIDVSGAEHPVLSAEEVEILSIPRGSLSVKERQNIESHVTFTFEFLMQIPWTPNLARVPDIAYRHHEKLDGSGYPQRLRDKEIPVQARMMAIADIYDALTASDRPYKKAMSHERAVEILKMEAGKGQLDMHLLDVFVGANVHHVLR